jgi:hypothetical protein
MTAQLLTATQAASRAGVDQETVWNWEALGLLRRCPGRRYREDDLAALLAGPPPAEPEPTWVRPGHAARILGRSTQTARRYAQQGWLTRDTLGWYDLADVQALRKRMGTAHAAGGAR